MALTDFKPQFDNAYQEIFQKVLVGKRIANLRFEPLLKYGESVERVLPDISAVRVRTVVRGAASTIDTITDSSELLTVNLEKEAVFHISDGEVKQAGPLNPGEHFGGLIATKVAANLDANILYEATSALYDFDTGDLTTGASTGVPFALDATNTPLAITRMKAKLRHKNRQTLTNLVWVIDSYAAADLEQFLISKSIDLAGSVFQNGYAGTAGGAEIVVSENLTYQATLTASGVFVNTQTVVIEGITFTSVSSIGSTAGNFLIGTAEESLGYLANLINNPGTTSATQVALSADDQELIDELGLTATSTATTLVITGKGSGALTVSETQTNCAWGSKMLHSYFGKKGAIDVVVQDMKEVDMRPTADRRGTNVFSYYLAGIKTFADGAKKFLDVLLAK